MDSRRFARVVAALVLFAACTSPVAPDVMVTFVGTLEGMTAEMSVSIAATVHGNDECAPTPVLARAATRPDPSGHYSFQVALPQDSDVCVQVVALAEAAGGAFADTVRVGVRDAVRESRDSVIVRHPTIRIVIPRPNP
jgi:hypothetical protein